MRKIIDNLNPDFYFKQIKKDLSSYQFETFLIGITNEEVAEEEKKLLKISLGQMIEKKLEKSADFINPDILIIIDLKNKNITYQIKPVYIHGCYQKIKPGIPQTRWHKKIYQTSVQEEIGKVILNYSQGTDHSFHGCGREDIDVVMLGDGRPFVIEIKNPKKRIFDLKKIEEEINNTSEWVRVKKLSFTNKKKIKELKMATPSKIYQAEIQLEKEVEEKELKIIEEKLSGATISQQTPKRVIRRRANLTRQRKIFYFKLIKFNPTTPIFEIKTQSGTYIKELVSGDQGRTKPSLSQLLNQKCFVQKLKVIKIEINPQGCFSFKP